MDPNSHIAAQLRDGKVPAAVLVEELLSCKSKLLKTGSVKSDDGKRSRGWTRQCVCSVPALLCSKLRSLATRLSFQ